MKFVVANWKMHGNLADALALAQASAKIAEHMSHVRVIIAPGFVHLLSIKEALRWVPHNFDLAAQTVSPFTEGAYTGDVAAGQLKGLVDYCIVGHSERRHFHHETHESVNHQIQQLTKAGITPIVCFGETHHTKGKVGVALLHGLAHDLHDLPAEAIEKCLFAYEPVWAIGTGKVASAEHIGTVVRHVKDWFSTTYKLEPKVLYGGSVSGKNASDIAKIHDIDGVLVGGASLHAKEVEAICRAFGHPI
jgi:triosephosphate isomerase (TIM)